MRDKVSIIVPVYNAEKYIERCIKSVCEQTYDNIELILVEDGSSDSSLMICRKLIQTMPSSKMVVHQNNMGQEATRNDGLKEAIGDWIFFLDADDTIPKYAIEKMHEYACSNQADIVMGDFQYCRENVEIVTSTLSTGLYKRKEFVNYFLKEISWAMISCIGNKLYKADNLSKKGIMFEAKYKFNEDGAFALKAIAAADTIYYMKNSVYNYIVQESDSVQSSYRKNMFDSVKNVHALLREVFLNNKCGDEFFRRLYFQQVTFIYVCLKNEVDYKDKKHFLITCKKIADVNNYLEACKNVSRNQSIGKWLFAKAFLHRWYNLLYVLIKIKK